MDDSSRHRLLLSDLRAAMAAWSVIALEARSEFMETTLRSRETIRNSQALMARADRMMSDFPLIARHRA